MHAPDLQKRRGGDLARNALAGVVVMAAMFPSSSSRHVTSVNRVASASRVVSKAWGIRAARPLASHVSVLGNGLFSALGKLIQQDSLDKCID